MNNSTQPLPLFVYKAADSSWIMGGVSPPVADLRCFTLLLGHRRLTFYSSPQQSTKKLAIKLTATAKSTTDCCWDITPP